MPYLHKNLNAPRRGFYERRISSRQMRQLKKISTDVTDEIRILRMKVYFLLDQLEGLTFYTDLDMAKLGMINTLVNTIARLVQRNRFLSCKDLDLGALLEETLREDAMSRLEP
jgi:predicted RNase H-like nuclease